MNPKKYNDLYMTKPYEEVRQHFIQRLFERREIVMTEDEYDEFMESDIVLFHKMNGYTSLAHAKFKGEKIWFLYNKISRMRSTVYDKDIDLDDEKLIRCVFGKKLNEFALIIHKNIIEELKPHIEKKFDTRKEAAVYYFENSPFADLLMSVYSWGKWKPKDMVKNISKIIYNEHKLVKIDLKLKRPLR